MVKEKTLNKRLMSLATRYARSLKKHLQERLVSVVLYGSVARGEATCYSDIDLLLVAEDLPEGRFARLDILSEVDKTIEVSLNTLWDEGIYTGFTKLLKTPKEAERIIPLYLDMTEDAIILYDKEDFFHNVLERLRKRLKELGSMRRRMGKVLYWDLKPDIKPGEVFEL